MRVCCSVDLRAVASWGVNPFIEDVVQGCLLDDVADSNRFWKEVFPVMQLRNAHRLCISRYRGTCFHNFPIVGVTFQKVRNDFWVWSWQRRLWCGSYIYHGYRIRGSLLFILRLFRDAAARSMTKLGNVHTVASLCIRFESYASLNVVKTPKMEIGSIRLKVYGFIGNFNLLMFFGMYCETKLSYRCNRSF